MLLFSASFILNQCLILYVEARITLLVHDVGELGICIMGECHFFVPEISGNEPQYSVGHFAAFLCLFFTPEVFGDDDSQIPKLICCRQLLIGHALLALYVVVSHVHHRTFLNILNSVARFGIICIFRQVLTILVSRSFIEKVNNSV